MAFNFRFSFFLLLQLFLIAGMFCLAGLGIFSPVFKHGFLHYSYIIYTLTAFALISQIYRPTYAGLFAKPILVANENYIYDFNHDVKYYWKDIREVYKKGSFLFIKLYHPENYLDKIGNPQRRFVTKLWFKPNSKRSFFFINIDFVDADQALLLKKLDNYRIQALENGV